MDEIVGTILDGKYEMIKLLGEGGMGAVYEAKHKLIGRRLAVKFLHPQYVTSEEVVTRFQREAQAAAAIGHENIIEVTDMGTAPDGEPYIVMEYLDGVDVKELLSREGAIPPERAAHILVQTLSALQAAHEVGIIHRDLKPENIYLIKKSGTEDYVKLLDFGISKFRSLESEGMKGLTQTGTVLGTPYYMSPEQARGDQDLGHRSDIYAVGVILFQMVTGILPFDAPNYNALLIKILTEDPPDPAVLNPSLPPDLVEVIKIAMARDASARFDNCVEFRRRLKQYAPGISTRFETQMSQASRTAVKAALSNTQTPLEMTKSGPIETEKKRSPLLLGGIAAGITAAIALAVFLFAGGGDGKKDIPIPAAPIIKTAPEQPVAMTPEVESENNTAQNEAKEPETITLKISASPKGANIILDGTLLQGNPFEGPMPKDDKTHELKITATGYDDQTATVDFKGDQTLSYKLEKQESGTSDRRSSKSSKHRKTKETTTEKAEPEKRKVIVTPTPTTPTTPPPKRPRRKIDDDDPWS